MPHCLVKSPNGKYHCYSTIVDNFLYIDASATEAIGFELRYGYQGDYPGGRKQLKLDLLQEVENIEKYGTAWKWAPTWEEAIKTVILLHGIDCESLGYLVKSGTLSKEALTAFQQCVNADSGDSHPAEILPTPGASHAQEGVR